MPELLEAVNPAIDFEMHDQDCYFCNKKKTSESKTNVFKDNFAEDTLIGAVTAKTGIKHKNDSGKLGEKCKPYRGELWVTEDHWGWELLVEYAAHHLIPGDAALANSTIMPYLGSEGAGSENIGYDVNNRINGVWLPGNYAFGNTGKWGKKGKIFEEKYAIPPAEYASAAIRCSGAQFHDSHEDYSDKVRAKLDEIADKLEEVEEQWCPKAKKEESKHLPMFALLNRLASLSMRLRKMVTFPTTNWRKNMFTSAFSQQWMAQLTRHRISKSK